MSIAEAQCKPYKELLNDIILKSLPPMPEKFEFREGWTKYFKDGSNYSVTSPDCDALVFDVEVSVTEGSRPTLAAAVSDQHWYSWCSKHLLKDDLYVYKNS